MTNRKSAPVAHEWGIVWRFQKWCGAIVFVNVVRVGQKLNQNVIHLQAMGEIFHQVVDVAPRQLARFEK
jgi:hypothetical protein